MKSNLKVFLKGIIDVSPLMIPVVPFGLIFGVLAIDVGFTPLETMGMSLIVFGGASQIVLLQLFSGGASSLVIISSVGAVNSRHLLYGAVLSEYLEKLTLLKKLIISYFIVDQGFAESNKYFKKNKDQKNIHYHLLGTGITLWICWQISTIMGIILGSFIPDELGLKFAVPLTFIAILVSELRKIDHVIVIFVSGISSLLFFEAPLKSYIIISPIIALFAASLVLRFKK